MKEHIMIEESGMYWENFINGNDDDEDYEGGRGRKNGREKREPVVVPDWIHIVLYTIFFTGTFWMLAEGMNSRYQVMEKVFLCFGLASFTAVMWVMQKVKLFNWQSFLLTIAFGIYAYFYIKMDGQGSDNLLNVVSILCYRYLMLMLLADIAITKRIRSNQKFIPWAFAFFCVMSVISFVDNRSILGSLVNLFVVVACFLPIGAKEWNKVMEGMFFGGLIAFIIYTIFSYVGDPLIIDRGDYYFSRPDIATFLGFALVLAIFGLFFFKEKYGRFSFVYNLSIAWIIGILVLAYFKEAFGFLPGIVLAGMLLIIFAVRKYEAKNVLIRVAIAIGACIVVVAGMFVYEKFMTPNPPASLEDFVKVTVGNRLELWKPLKGMMDWYSHTISPDGDGIYFIKMRVQYFNYLYEYSIITGALNILFILVMGVMSVIQYVKTGRNRFLLAMLAIFMMLGVWFNASAGMNTPLGLAALLSAYPLIVELKGGKKKVKKAKGEAGKGDEESAEESGSSEEEKPVKKKKAETSKESKEETAKDNKAESVKEIKAEPVRESKEESATESDAESKKVKIADIISENKPVEAEEKSAKEEKAVIEEKPAKAEKTHKEEKHVKAEPENPNVIPKEHITAEESAKIDAQINTGVIDLGNTGPMTGGPLDRSKLEDVAIMDFEIIQPGEAKEEK